MIEVEYEELPILLDPFDAMADGAPLIHPEYPGNICGTDAGGKGAQGTVGTGVGIRPHHQVTWFHYSLFPGKIQHIGNTFNRSKLHR